MTKTTTKHIDPSLAGYNSDLQDSLSVLNSRGKYLDRFGYKLNDGVSFALDVPILDELDISEQEMSVVFPFADGRRRDGVGDLLEIGGIRTDRHRLNPLILFDHGKSVTMPIALAEDPKTREYTIFLDAASQIATCKAFFYQCKDCGGDYNHAVFCEQLFDLVCKRYIRAGSIGFTVVNARELQPNYETGTPKGLHLLAINMLEASIVVMPANQDTVRKALSLPKVCGQPLSPILVKSLSPYAPEKKALVAVPESVPVPLNEDLSKTDVSHSRWKPGAGAIKNVNELRMKYRKTKNVRRRVKKSSPGASVIYLNGKDLKAAQDLAKAKGVKFSRIGVKGDLEKVRLSGDDDSIDEVAKQFGRPVKGIKSMATKNKKITKTKDVKLVQTKEMEQDKDVYDDDHTPGDEALDQEADDGLVLDDSADLDVPQEKYSAQVLRRIHEDYRTLMADYDRMMGPLENEAVAKLVQSELEHHEEFLTALEGIWNEHHSDLPGLDGAMKDMTEDETGEEKGLDSGPDTDSVPADSVPDEEDDTTSEESAEVMMEKRLKNVNALRKQIRTKSCKCKELGDIHPGPCKNGKNGKSLEKKEEGHKDLTQEEAGDIAQDIETQSEDTEANPAVDDKGLKDHEVPVAREATNFLKELGETQDFGEEHRMKSFHYHKSLEFPSGNDLDSNENYTGQKNADCSYEKMHPHRKMCKDASGFFERLAYEKSFGDPHRQEAMMHHKNMDEMLQGYGKAEPPVTDQPQEEETPEQTTEEMTGSEDVTGELKEKRLNRLDAMLSRLQTLVR